jgi:signal transduction histidine kinase
MNAQQLASRVVGWQVMFSCMTALALHFLVPFLFLLDDAEGRAAAFSLTLAVLVAGSLSIAQGWSLVWARRKLLTNLEDRESRTHNQIEIPKLNDDPWLIVNSWLYAGIFAVALTMTALRPEAIPPSSALSLGLFSVIMLAAASLPLLMLVRGDFVRVMEQVPPEVMAEIIDAQVRSGRLRGRASRRLLAAVATPVAFLALGSALIAGAHVRSLEEGKRIETARRAVGAVLAPVDGEEPNYENSAYLAALGALSKSGFRVRILDLSVESEELDVSDGIVNMQLPVGKDNGSQISFVGTTAWAINWPTIPVALLALLAASWVGLALARLLSRDLRMANHGVRMLGTDAALEGTRVMKPARFRAVADLGHAIELLGSKFRLFAQAQEHSISARESATRARGRFFASVSHDLKSPLNAILGFTEITLRDPVTSAPQKESLDMILQRGRELLGLIETILDAARVEAGQLHLDIKDERVEDLLDEALEKARDLSPDHDILTRFDIPPDVPHLPVDRLRFSQALATFLGHARRTSERGSLRVLVQTEPKPERPSLKKRKISLFIEIPSSRFSAQDLEGMLNPEQHPGRHRGLSLALRLAKSVIELHGGSVGVTGRTVSEPAFVIHLRGRGGR